MDQYTEKMKQELPARWQWLVLVLFFFSLLTLLNIVQLPKSARVILEAATDSREYAQLFWLSGGDGYSTENSSRLLLRPDRDSYNFKIKPVYNLEKLRFDPSVGDSRVVIKRMALVWDTETVFDLTAAELKDVLTPVQGVSFTFNQRNNALAVIATGNDPIIELNAADASRRYRYSKLSKQVFIVLPLTILVWGLLHYFNTDTFIRSSHSTYPTRKRHWIYWLAFSVALGAFFSFVTPVSLSATIPALHFTALSVAVGVGLFLFAFWFVTREMIVVQAGYTSRWSWLWFALPSYIVWTFYLLCLWPGSMSPDSFDQWKQVLNGHFKDWHPAFHSMTIWLVTRINLSPATVAISQIIALGSVIGWTLAVLQRFGVTRTVLWITSFVVALLPVNGLIVVTLWKDVTYSIVMLVLAVYIFQIVMGKGAWLKLTRNWFYLGVVLALVSLYRHNGIIPACGVGVLLLVIYRNHWKGLVVSIIIAISIHAGVQGPLYDVLDVNRDNPLAKIEERLIKQFRALLAGKQEMASSNMKRPDGDIEKPLFTSKPVMDRIYSASPVWRILPMTTFHKRIEYVNFWREQKQNDAISIKYMSSNKLGIDEAPVISGGPAFLYKVFNESRYNKYLFWMWRPSVFLYFLSGLLFLLSWRFRKRLYLVTVPALLNSLPLFLVVIHKSIFRYHYPTVILALLFILPLLFLKPIESDDYD